MDVQETAATEEIADRILSALTSRDPSGLEPLLVDDARWGSCVGRNQVIEYMSGVSRGLVEGWFPPLTDITDWATVPAALGHPVPIADTIDQFADDQLDDDILKSGQTLTLHGVTCDYYDVKLVTVTQGLITALVRVSPDSEA